MADNRDDIKIPFPEPEAKRRGVNTATLPPQGIRWGKLDMIDIELVCDHYGFTKGEYIRNVVCLVTEQLKQRIRANATGHKTTRSDSKV